MKGECAFCGSKTEVTEYDMNECPNAKLCLICGWTPAGNAFEYPDQYRASRHIMQQISFVGNLILNAIRKDNEKE